MLFSSILFLLYFFPIVFLGYYLCAFSRLLQNIWLFAASLVFYAWGEPVYVLLMLASILLNWAAGMLLGRPRVSKRSRKFVMVVACVLNLGMLFVFKYMGFLLRNLPASLRGGTTPLLNLALPIGISFFTFQALSYVLDVYRRDTKVERNPFYVGLYVAFFPQLIAGPIVRYNSVAQQIHIRKSSWHKCSVGICRFVVGLGKKIVLSNNFAILADLVFNQSAMGTEAVQVPALMAWLGAIAYTLQIYFDFSGYSDMAIGLGLMFGFKFDENFNYPYAATSMVDFWRRWHISLTSWFREYVYFPLGGSRVENQDTMIRNLFIVWLLTGIWHGAEWTFLLWGLWHFAFQLAERFFGYAKNNPHRLLMRLYTLFVVCIGWVLFRAQDLYQAGRYLLNMLGMNRNGFMDEFTLFLLRDYGVYLLLGLLFSAPIAPGLNRLLADRRLGALGVVMQAAYPVALIGLFTVCLTYLVRGGYNPFIYFNF